MNPVVARPGNPGSLSTAIPIIAGGMIVLALSFGFRSSFGVFLQPVSEGLGWPRETFSLSLAIQNLAWGLGGPLFGALADRFGGRRSLMLGAACYTLGLLIAATATSPIGQHLGSGLLVGMGCAGTGFGLVLAIVGRSVPESRRARVLAVTSAAGSIGQFAVVPLARLLEAHFGWEQALLGLALASLACFACIPFLRTNPVESEQTQDASLGRAISNAGSDGSFWLLTLGFFTCGFHVAFIGAHLPAYVTETCGSATLGSWAISIIGLGNVLGVLIAGEMSARWRKKHVLSGIYGARAVLILAFLAVPPSPATVVAFAILSGLVWLATVPLTIHLVAHLHGTRFMATLYGLVFLGAPDRWIPRRLVRRLGIRPDGNLRLRLVDRDISWRVVRPGTSAHPGIDAATSANLRSRERESSALCLVANPYSGSTLARKIGSGHLRSPCQTIEVESATVEPAASLLRDIDRRRP